MSHRYHPMIVVPLALLGGCPTESKLPAAREPRCEPRSTPAPGRLTLDTRAEHYGTTPSPRRLCLKRPVAACGVQSCDSVQREFNVSGAQVCFDD